MPMFICAKPRALPALFVLIKSDAYAPAASDMPLLRYDERHSALRCCLLRCHLVFSAMFATSMPFMIDERALRFIARHSALRDAYARRLAARPRLAAGAC